MFNQRSRAATRGAAALSLLELESRDVPTFLTNQLFAVDNPWNQVVSGAPVASNSNAIISRIVNRHGGTAPAIHADFGNPTTDNALYGIPINIATSATPKVAVVVPSFGYPSESDSVQVPIPAGAVIEGDGPTGPAAPGAAGTRTCSCTTATRTCCTNWSRPSARRKPSTRMAARTRPGSGARTRFRIGT